MERDRSGRLWAAVAEIKAGSVVRTDGDFTCIGRGRRKVVRRCNHGLFITCREGTHLIEGQLSADGKSYIGLYPIRA